MKNILFISGCILLFACASNKEKINTENQIDSDSDTLDHILDTVNVDTISSINNEQYEGKRITTETEIQVVSKNKTDIAVTSNKATSTPFAFSKATKQSWSGGAAGSGSGIKYKITVILNKADITFNKLWVDGYELDIVMARPEPGLRKTINTSKPDKGETIILTANAFNPKMRIDKNTVPGEAVPEGLKETGSLKNDAPKPFTGEGLLSYNENGKIKYFEIKNFQKLPSIAYP